MVIAAVDIVQLIGQTVSLKRSGTGFIGLCPFHNEKSPSFHVKPDRQFFYCFGCKAAGNVIDFVMKRDRVEFKEALVSLAQANGIELPRFGPSREKMSERQGLLEACSAAAAFFQQNLNDVKRGHVARSYLAQRGFTDETIQRFQIGLAFNEWEGLAKHPSMRKFSQQQLLQAGLVKQREGQTGVYDTFRDRIIFPIRDENGRVIAFGGRITPEGNAAAQADGKGVAKYLNSPETPLYTKSKVAYGLDMGRQRIVETRTVGVVEGYTDVVMAHQVGATNVVSPLGTALTETHVQVLRRFADRIVLIFDGDEAGDAAVNRVVELFLTQPVEIAIATMPGGMDPDEFLLAHGTEGFDQLLAGAQDALTYQWKLMETRFRSNADDMTGQTKAIESYLALLSHARQAGPVDSLRWHTALARVSKLTGVPSTELNKRFGTSVTRKRAPVAETPALNAAPLIVKRGLSTGVERAEQWLLGILLNEPNRWDVVQREFGPTDFVNNELRELATIYWDYQRDEGQPGLQELVAILATPDLKALAIELSSQTETSSETDRVLRDSLTLLRNDKRRRIESTTIANLRRSHDCATGDDLLRTLQNQKRGEVR